MRDDDLVLQSIEVWQALDLLGVGACQNARCSKGESSRRASGHDAPLDVEQFGEAVSHLLHQFVQVYVKVRSLLHGDNHFGQRQGAAVYRERRGAIDKGADADAGVDFRRRTGGGRRDGWFEAGRSGGHETARLNETASADAHTAPCVTSILL